MLLLLICSQVFADEKTYGKGVEGYASYTKEGGPHVLRISGGHALAFVEFEDTTIKVEINGVLTKPKVFTKSNGVSLFTFKDDAVVTIDCQTKGSFYIVSIPNQVKTNTGIYLVMQTYNSHKFNFEVNQDVYLAYPFTYHIKGTVTASTGKIRIRRTLVEESGNKVYTTDVAGANFEYSPVAFTTYFIRTIDTSTIKLTGETLCNTEFTPTIPTSYVKKWNSIDENSNFEKNAAYGGSDKNLKEIELVDSAEEDDHTTVYGKGVEGYASYTKADCPHVLKISGGHALAFVEFEDTTIKVEINGVLTKPKVFTKSNGVSLFTFKDDAVVTIDCQTKGSFYIVSMPNQVKTNTGIYLVMQTYNSHKFNFEVNQDVYLAYPFTYHIKGTVTASTGKIRIRRTLVEESGNKVYTTDVAGANFEYSPVAFTTYFIRTIDTSTIKLTGETLCNTEFTPTIPTSYVKKWNSIDENSNFEKNAAYGGSDKNLKEIELVDSAEGDDGDNNGDNDDLTPLEFHLNGLVNGKPRPINIYIENKEYSSQSKLLEAQQIKIFNNLDSNADLSNFKITLKYDEFNFNFDQESLPDAFKGKVDVTSTASSRSPEKKKGLSTGAIAGIVVGCVVVVGVVVGLLVYFLVVKKKKVGNSASESP